MYKSHNPLCSVAANYLTALLLCTFQFQSIYGHPSGAPERTCGHMNPGHGEKSLNSNSPYEIKVERTFIRGAGRINIQVVSTKPSTHKLTGLLIIMKKPGDKLRAYGTFDPTADSDNLKTISCFGKPGTGITHSNNREKTQMSFHWIAPNDTSAEYELHATLVRSYNSFWADIVYPQKIIVHSDAPAAAETLQINLIAQCILIFVAAVAVPLLSV